MSVEESRRSRHRPLNLGFCFLPLKVVLDTPFLSCLWTDLAEIWCTFYQTPGPKSIKVSAKLVHRRPGKGVSDTTLEGKIQRPKFKGRGLRRRERAPLAGQRSSGAAKWPSTIFPEWIINEAKLSLVPFLVDAGGRFKRNL